MNTKIISVNITKGGCGKTTTVQALAELLGRDGKRVLCVDTDPQCNLTTVSGIPLESCSEFNLYKLLKGECDLQNCIKKSEYYDLIPGSLLLAFADTEFNQLGREYMLKEILEEATDYDVILIDTPPALGILNIMSLTCSTDIIISAELSYLAMVGLDQLSDTITSVRKHSNKELNIAGILLIKYAARTNLSKLVAEGLESMSSKLNTQVFESKIRETVKIKEAQSQCVPLLEWDAKCNAMKDYESLYDELKPILNN